MGWLRRTEAELSGGPMVTRIMPHIVVMVLLTLAILMVASAQEVPSVDNQPVAPTLTWVDAQTGATLFSLADIVRFDWDKQLFELTPALARVLLSLPITQYRDFAVKDNDGVIYRGRLYRSNSHEGYDGSTIVIDQGMKQTIPAAPFFTINGGYPIGGGAHDQERFAARMKMQLDNANVLTPIAESDLPHGLKWMGNSWIGGEQVLCASPGIFPNTVRLGKPAYLHIKFTKGNHPKVQFDRLEVVVTCIEKEQHFTVTQELVSLSSPPLGNEIYVCSFIPWKAIITPPAPDNLNAPPTINTSQPPPYPKNAVNEHRGGKFIVALQIGADGKVGNQTILLPTGSSDLDKSALRAVQKMTFSPAIKNGQPVADTIKVQFEFADEQVQQTILPQDPIEAIAKPGKMTLIVTFNTFKKTTEGFVPCGNCSLPPYEVNLLPDKSTATPLANTAPVIVTPALVK